MAVKFSTKGYNVGTIDITTKLDTSEAKNVGVESDLDMIKMLAMTGFCKMKFTVAGTPDAAYDIGVLLTNSGDTVEFGAVTYTSDGPVAITGSFGITSHKLTCAVSVDALTS